MRIQTSIFCVFAMSFVRPIKSFINAFDIVYVENLLNLLIAAVYPLCFLTMSGEMRRLGFSGRDFVISLNEISVRGE